MSKIPCRGLFTGHRARSLPTEEQAHKNNHSLFNGKWRQSEEASGIPRFFAKGSWECVVCITTPTSSAKGGIVKSLHSASPRHRHY